jgi:hypothetical protein
MFISTLLITLIVPMQMSMGEDGYREISLHWVTVATIDAARLIGLAAYRNKVPLSNLNPELNLREMTKEDMPMPRRKQFVQDYINNVIVTASR